MRWNRVIMVVAVCGVACGGGFKPETYASPERLLEASIAEYRRGNCGGAERGFLRVALELPPRDPGIAVARYYLAECYFRGGDFLEASAQFRRVADEHPTHERAPVALLRAGDAFARLWKRPELDPTYGESALSTYREVLTRFPEAEVAGQARDKIATLGDKFAEKDLKNGEFYFRLGAYDSAIIYFRYVVERFPTSRYAPMALMRLVETYRRIGYEEEARETCEHLRRFYQGTEGLDDLCPAESPST